VTGTPRPGSVRSIGASLLDQVLAETLDPAYAQAAEARAARERAGERPVGGTARGRLGGRLLVAVVLAIAGLLIAMTYNLAAAGAKGRQQVRAGLLSDIAQQQRTTTTLSAQLDRLQRQASTTRDQALAATAVGQAALDRLAANEQAAAAVPVTGKGLVVTLADAKQNADADPVGGRTTPDPRGLVRDSDLQVVANALWAAGAEAISINGQRLGPTSAIRLAGDAVLVDFNPVTSPYKVSAIGDPTAMSRNFLASSDVAALASVSESFGLRFDFVQADDLSLPAAAPMELRSAQAVTPPATPSTTPSATPSGAAPGPTPSTPGG
jgi:uncharacterized protein YlxW (UPF0749 family)